MFGYRSSYSMEDILVEKIEDHELPIPTEWRLALKQLADKIVLGAEIEALPNIEIGLIDSETVSSHNYNIEGYPDKLGPLQESSWKTSIYIWDSPYWQVLVDLADENGNISDLVLHARIHETAQGFLIEPGLVYVP